MYERCPYQYYLAQVLGLPTPSKGALVFGDVIHRTLKEFVEQSSALTGMAQVSLFSTPVTEARILSYVDLLKIYERNWLDDWYSDRKVRDEYYELGRQILKNFQADFEQEKPKVRLLEQPFKTEFGSFRITGRIDRIDDIEGGIEIIDYKTGEGKDLNTLDKQQLMLYQIVAEKELKLTPIKLTYHYLNDNKKVSFLGNEKQKEKLIEDWMERMEKIQRREFKASPGEFVCQFCDFKGMCEFRKL
jgi:DNA helicase-2/ATP-dependent DNA helicase PcrA